MKIEKSRLTAKEMLEVKNEKSEEKENPKLESYMQMECFCRYKGLTEVEFRKFIERYAEEFNAFCAGFKAGRF